MLLETFYTVFLCCSIQYIFLNTQKCLTFLVKGIKKVSPHLGNYLELHMITSSIKPPVPSMPVPRVYSKPDNDPCYPFKEPPNFSPCCDMVPSTSSCCSPSKPKSITFVELLDKYEAEHNTKVIILHHGKTSAFFGLSSNEQALNQNDAQEFADIIRNSNKPISLIIHTNGGSLTSAEVIVNALTHYTENIKVYIPYKCASAGTLIALCSNEIYMDKNAYCGTIDPQCWGISVCDVVKFCATYSESTSWIGDICKLALSQANAAVNRMKDVLNRIPNIQNNMDVITHELLSGKYNHDKPLFIQDMTKIVPINEGIPEEIMKLYKLYLTTTNKTTTVQDLLSQVL